MAKVDFMATWQLNVVPMICENCDARFLMENGARISCPNCYRDMLDPVEEADQMPMIYPPELVYPDRNSTSTSVDMIRQFISSIPIPPPDLSIENLKQRSQLIYVPMWLVDVDVETNWRGDFGFDYQVRSHKVVMTGHSSRERTVMETKSDWESRVGTAEKHYANISTPALQELRVLLPGIDKIDNTVLRKYSPHAFHNRPIRLPDIRTEDAWQEAKRYMKLRLEEECQKATGAERVRSFSVSDFDVSSFHWTHLLVPMVSSYYMDDEGVEHRIMMNPDTRELDGARRASVKLAMRIANRFALLGLIIFGIGLALAFTTEISILILVGLFIGAGVALNGYQVVNRMKAFNEKQSR